MERQTELLVSAEAVLASYRMLKCAVDNFKRDWILDAMEHGKMTREEAEHCWQQQEYREG